MSASHMRGEEALLNHHGLKTLAHDFDASHDAIRDIWVLCDLAGHVLPSDYYIWKQWV